MLIGAFPYVLNYRRGCAYKQGDARRECLRLSDESNPRLKGTNGVLCLSMICLDHRNLCWKVAQFSNDLTGLMAWCLWDTGMQKHSINIHKFCRGSRSTGPCKAILQGMCIQVATNQDQAGLRRRMRRPLNRRHTAPAPPVR